MSNVRGSCLALSMVGLLVTSFAHAGEWDSKCKKAGDDATKACQGAVDKFTAADASRKAVGSATSTNDAHGNGGNLQDKIQGNDADLATAIASCEAEKSNCKGECDQQKSALQPHLNPQDKRFSEASGDNGKIDGTKKSSCEEPIEKKKKELEAGKSPLGKQAKEAEKTKDEAASGGQPPQMPPMPKKEDSSDTGSSAAGATASALNCTVSGGSRFSDCNTTFVSKCTSAMSASECDQFSDRYCNLSSAASTSASSLSTPAQATTNLNIDKKGEGLGSSYCNFANAYRYCQTPGRESCPSCISVYAAQNCVGVACMARSSTSITDSARAACPDDPSFLSAGGGVGVTSAFTSNPTAAVVALPTNTVGGSTAGNILQPASTAGAAAGYGGGSGSGAGGGAVGGGGGSGGFGSSPNANGPMAAASEGANREGTSRSIIGSDGGLGGGGGGGGGSGEAPWISSEERTLASIDVKKAFDGPRAETAAAVPGVAADVSRALGPSIFSLGSGAIKSFCIRGNLPSCR